MFAREKVVILLIVLFGFANVDLVYAQTGFTSKDREVLIELRVKMEEINRRFEQVDKRFEQIERRIERLEGVMLWGFGLLFTSMIGMVGFVLWDRRTAVAPLSRILKEKEIDIEELKRREMEIEGVLRDYAKLEPRLAELLRARGLIQ